MVIERDDDAYVREVSHRITEMTLAGTAPWMNAHKAGEAEVAYCPLMDPAPLYSGVNAVLLDMVAADRGYSDPRWIPMAIVESSGLAPKHGEKPICLAFRNRYVEVTDTNPFEGTAASALANSAKRLSYYYVYNAEQIRGMPSLQKDRETSLVKMKRENALKNLEARTSTGLLDSLTGTLPPHDCRAQETLKAIARYRLACHLRLPYKPEVSVEKIRREVKQADRDTLLRSAYFGANDASAVTNPRRALIVEPRRTTQRDPELSQRTKSRDRGVER